MKTIPYPKIFLKNLPILWKKPDFCCGFDSGTGGTSATATGPVFTDGPKPGAGVLATVAALSGVAIPEGVPVGTVCLGAVYASVVVTSEWISPGGTTGLVGGAGGAASPSLSASGKAVSAGVELGPSGWEAAAFATIACPGLAAGWPGSLGAPVLATETIGGGAAGQPQVSRSWSTTSWTLPCSNRTR